MARVLVCSANLGRSTFAAILRLIEVVLVFEERKRLRAEDLAGAKTRDDIGGEISSA